jgi:hypothetical protein
VTSFFIKHPKALSLAEVAENGEISFETSSARDQVF